MWVRPGIPDPVDRSADLATAHRSARDCLRRCSPSAATVTARTTAELGFVGVLLSSGDTGAVRRRHDRPVLEYDAARGSDLAATLDAWFGQGGHLGRTAGVLHIHPNTVGQRLTRVGKLLGPDWSDPGRALQIQLALQLRAVWSARR